MTLIEILLIVLLIGIAIDASLNDLLRGSIPNRLLLLGLIAGTILNSVYYGGFMKSLIWNYLVNLFVVAVVSILLYGFHIWSAGDSKFSILLVFLLPGQFYVHGQKIIAPAIVIFIYIFSIGFLYVIVESVVLGIKRKDLLNFPGFRFNIKQFFSRFIAVSSMLLILSQIILILFPIFYKNNHLLILFLNLFLILLFQNRKWTEQPIMVSGLAFACLSIWLLSRTQVAINWWIYLVVGLVIFVRRFSEKYNYEVIETSSVRPGMILSLSTVVRFHLSNIKGLPLHTTEDLRSRLTENEVRAIWHWEKSKRGESSIVIVRKLPFALIISVSMLLFILSEVYLV